MSYRLSKGTTEHFTSFQEAAAAFGCKPISRKTKDEKKLATQQEEFCNKHKCKACGQPMSYIGGHWMTCTNDNCKGIKIEKEDKEGNKIVSYIVSCENLRERDARYASNIF